MKKGATILIIEDEPDIRPLLEALLVQHGFRPVAAADFRQALSILDQSIPDYMIIDNCLPDGFGSNLSSLHIPSVVYSGSRSSPINGARVICKPSPLSLIISALEESERDIMGGVAV